MWNTLWDELREVLWLASIVGGLLMLSVAVAFSLAAVWSF